MPYQSIVIDTSLVLNKVGIMPGEFVADLGTGRDARFALAAARAVGPEGRVYAVDIVQSILPAIKSKAEMYALNNLETVWSDLEIYAAAKKIVNQSLDLAFLVTVLFQSHRRSEILREAVRMLKKHGKLVIIDWKNLQTPFGPTLEQRVQPTEIKSLAENLGLELLEEFSASEYHYGLIFRKVF